MVLVKVEVQDTPSNLISRAFSRERNPIFKIRLIGIGVFNDIVLCFLSTVDWSIYWGKIQQVAASYKRLLYSTCNHILVVREMKLE